MSQVQGPFPILSQQDVLKLATACCGMGQSATLLLQVIDRGVPR